MDSALIKLLIAGSLIFMVASQNVSRKFPDGFMFGVATSAFQVEGAWNVDGRGESMWDRFIHTKPDQIKDRSNADIACDSYRLYDEDIRMLKELGVDFYRFSISWTRILPTGYANYINPKGVEYYNNLINGLISNNITPLVTMYHWDIPQKFQDMGGWTNSIVADYFLDYARVLLDNFGDRVKYWMTFNEIQQICQDGYGLFLAPMLNLSGTADYLCTRTTLLAHARVYHLYDQVYRPTQKGVIGMVTQSGWYEPLTNKTEDIEAAERSLLFHLGLFTDPIHSKTGDFPEIVKRYVAKKSKDQGYPFSRLPSFTPEEVNYIKGTADFLGLNYYTTALYADGNGTTRFPKPSYEDDCDGNPSADPTWKQGKSDWQYIVPIGLRKILNWVTKRYDAPQILILETGYSGDKELNDTERVRYHRSHLEQVLTAIHDDGCNVTHYTAWSLMDNFEWMWGYVSRFGLYAVDFNHPNRTRTIRGSGVVYKEIIRSRVIDWNFDHKVENSANLNILSRALIISLAIILFINHKVF